MTLAAFGGVQNIPQASISGLRFCDALTGRGFRYAHCSRRQVYQLPTAFA
jgi:hypothetical protein